MSRMPKLGQLVSMTQVARIIQRPRRTAFYQLMALYRADARDGHGDWLQVTGRRGKKWINLTRLRARHPALFERRFVTGEQFTELELRVLRNEEMQRADKQRLSSTIARVRVLESASKSRQV